MTKLRAPDTTEQAIARIAGVLGWPRMAELLNRAERTVRKYGDPDEDEKRLALDDALALDIAYAEAGGDGFPLRDSYQARLDIAHVDPVTDARRIAMLAMMAAKEGGDAVAALIEASLPHAGRAHRLTAGKEVREFIQALTNVLPLLDAEELGGGAPA